MTGPTWILFDAVGTLMRPVPSVRALYQRIGSQHGVHVSLDEIELRFRANMQKHFSQRWQQPCGETEERSCWQRVVREVLRSDSEALFADVWAAFARANAWRLYEDVAPCWHRLRSTGWRLAIASNFDARLHDLVAELAPLGEAEHIFCSSEIGWRKPHAEFFRAVEARLGAPGQDLLLVGDDVVADVEGARQAGWGAVHLDRDGDGTATLGRISSLRELDPQMHC